VDFAAAKADQRQSRYSPQVQIVAQYICVIAENIKQQVGSNNVDFRAEDFLGPMDPDGALFHAAIGLLIEKGRAKESPRPGYWLIDDAGPGAAGTA
jgi:hypothetical protein